MSDLLDGVAGAAPSNHAPTADDVAASIEASRAKAARAPRAQQKRSEPGPANVRDQLAAVQDAAVERMAALIGADDQAIAEAFDHAKAGRDAWIVSVSEQEPQVIVGRPRLVDAIARLSGRAAVVLDVSGLLRGLAH